MNAKELLKRPQGCFIDSSHPAMEDPGHWCVGPVILHRDSDILTQANYKSLVKALENREDLADEWSTHNFSHWAVGWVEHLSFRVLGDDGEPTPMFHFVKEWFDGLADYPIADEEIFSEMEAEAAESAIEDVGKRWLCENPPDDWVGKVAAWLMENDPGEMENTDGNGAYPSEESVRNALRSLGIHEKEEEEEG